jgi:hypothetical protein
MVTVESKIQSFFSRMLKAVPERLFGNDGHGWFGAPVVFNVQHISNQNNTIGPRS